MGLITRKLSAQSSKKNTKFAIDGDIQSPKESSYLKELDKLNAKRFKRLASFVSIGLLVCIGFIVFQQLKMKQLRSEHNTLLTNQSTISLKESLESLTHENDSLALLLAKVELSNELLKENFDASDGIFFEVQMDFEGDFDLQQYKKELSRLISSEYDNRDKLLLGRFKSFKKALLFENDLKKMGLKNLYLLGRVDGKIMTFKEALAVAQSQNN